MVTSAEKFEKICYFCTMSFKINKNTGKVGEFIPVDFSKTEPIFDEDISIERPGIYKFIDGELILTDGNEVYVYKNL